MSIRLEIRGGPELQRALRSVRGVFPAALGAALYRFGVAIASNALPRTPVEFGLLRASHYVSPPNDEDRPTVEIGFGTRYAVAQHEQAHLRHPRGGQAFYLRNAVDALSPRALQLLARDIVRLAIQPAIEPEEDGRAELEALLHLVPERLVTRVPAAQRRVEALGVQHVEFLVRL
ncbi:MAG TPA: hypothetical protein PLV92_04690, partial [Pirellulaceae bacterium]|nr:hypothetical protein [Pirellulaceae bacterium]